MKVILGTRELEFPSEELQQLTDSNHLLGDVINLRKELQTQGYQQSLSIIALESSCLFIGISSLKNSGHENILS